MNAKIRRAENAFPDMVYQKGIVEFYSIQQYMINFTSPGDWIIPLCGDYDTFENCFIGKDLYESDQECMNDYEPSLFRIYRRQDNEVALKNTRKLGGKNASMHGLMGKLYKAMNRIDKIISMIPAKVVSSVCKELQKIYDSVMIDETTNHVVEITVWIPLWKPFTEEATVFTLFGRINLVFT